MTELAAEEWFPTYKGAFVYDLRLQKWGKFNCEYKLIVDYQGVTNAMPDNLATDNFGVDAGVLKADGFIYSFTADSDVSWIRYGKIGFSRQGFTKGLEVRADFRTPSKGSITIDSSMDGRDLDPELQLDFPYEYCRSFVAKFSNAARWQTVTISGRFDLQFLEFRGNISGIR